MITAKIISEQKVKKLINGFSNPSNIIDIEEDDISKLFNGRRIYRITLTDTGDKIENTILENIDNTFTCCLINAQNDFTMNSIQQLITKIPSKEIFIGLRVFDRFEVTFLVNER